MKKLSTWLIIIGVIILLIPIAGRIYMHYEQQKLYDEYLTSLEADIMDTNFVDSAPQKAADKPPAAEEEQKIDGVIGRIQIPSISVDLLLLEGSSGKELKYGAGHVSSTALPGQAGNCAIAGHRDYTFGTYFSRLDEVKNKDIVIIDYGGKEYTYEVYESFVVEPTEVAILAATDQPILTLITCTPKGHGTHRLIMRAKLSQ